MRYSQSGERLLSTSIVNHGVAGAEVFLMKRMPLFPCDTVSMYEPTQWLSSRPSSCSSPMESGAKISTPFPSHLSSELSLSRTGAYALSRAFRVFMER